MIRRPTRSKRKYTLFTDTTLCRPRGPCALDAVGKRECGAASSADGSRQKRIAGGLFRPMPQRRLPVLALFGGEFLDPLAELAVAVAQCFGLLCIDRKSTRLNSSH